MQEFHHGRLMHVLLRHQRDARIHFFRDGPPAQDGRVSRGLLWQAPTLSRLRQLCKRAEWWKNTAPWIALAGPPVFFVLARGFGGRRKS